MYFAPLLEVLGNLPVWSEKSVPFISIHFIVILFYRTISFDVVVISQEDVSDAVIFVSSFFVDFRFCLIWRMWPLAVYTLLGRFFLTTCAVSPDHVA